MKPVRNLVVGGAMAAAVLGGVLIGASFTGIADAATPTPSASSSSSSDHDSGRAAPDWSKGGHHANGKTETVLTGDNLAKATAAAQKAVPGATVRRAETDADGAAYEVHMTKSDGSVVTVKLDSSFTVTDTLDGMG